jgi:ribose-phosphate pyrophosphokinase
MPLQFNPVKLFAGSGTTVLAQKIAESYGKPLGDVSLSRFSDGEFQPHFNESVRGCDIFLIQSTIPPTENLMELLLMTDAAKRASAHYITVVVPYFGFARQDRKDKPRVAIGAKLIANLITAAGAHRIMTMDLHAAQIQGFFDIPVDHLDASVIFVPYIKSLNRRIWEVLTVPVRLPNILMPKWLFVINEENVPTKSNRCRLLET